jgi:two-component system CheB/CheR fusion protein
MVTSHWEGAELGELARSQLQAYLVADGNKIRLEGDAVTLSSDLATPFGLILHELATNAAKYGALSSNHGYIRLSWEVLNGNNGRQLRVVWRECDGPPVKMPKKNGFGSLLIEKSLPGATVQHQYLPDGVLCTIEFPLHEIDADGVSPKIKSS